MRSDLQTENLNKTSHGFYEKFIQALPFSTFQISPYGKYSILKDVHSALLVDMEDRTGNFWSDVKEEISEEIWMHQRLSLKSGKVSDTEVTYTDKSGERVWLRFTIIGGDGTTFVTCEDITDKKKNIEQLMKDERLSTIGILAGGLAHQYNNLHHAILALIYEAKNSKTKHALEKKLDSASLMLEQGSSLSQSLLSHLRDSDEDTVPAATNDIFSRVEMLVRDELLKHNSRLNINAENLAVMCKPTALDQVLVNLIINGGHACHDNENGGKIVVSTSVRSEAEIVEIRVSDNGSGIKPDEVSKLFTPLFSTKGVYAKKNSKLSNIKGTGLGLSLAKQLIEEQGGSLALEKTSSKGTTFLISLPQGNLDEIDEPLKFNGPENTFTEKQFKIYIADDSPDNRAILRVYLKDQTEKLIEAENGKINPEELLKFDPDIIFIDWLMPDYSGHDFMKFLTSESSIKHYTERVIILSGLDISEEISTWKDSVHSVLKKPISRPKLLRLLEDINP